MQIDERREGAALVLTPRGRLDALSAQAFQERLLGRIEAGERAVVIDGSGLDYISSVGLRALLSATKRLGEHGGRLAFCAPTANVREVLQVSGFDTILEIHADAASALAALA